MAETPEDHTTVHLLIIGRVQGVGYRAWADRKARELGLQGWVRNLRSGNVEAVVEGSPATVDQMIEACHNGPDWARVDEISISDAPPVQEPGFTILPTP